MKRYVIIIIFFVIGFTVNAQTVFWTEDFDGVACVPGSGCDPNIVSWIVTPLAGEGANANLWYVSSTENGEPVPNCGTSSGGDQSLHVGNVSTSAAAFFFCPNGDCGAAYDDSGAAERTAKRVGSPVIDCTGKSGITIDFNYIESGQGAADDCVFSYFDGAGWVDLDPIPKSDPGCGAQGRWTAISTISLPASANNNPNVRIGYLWVNDGDGVASDPSAAIDDISVSFAISLPVTLLNFDGEKQKNETNLLEWTTSSEINNDFFTIERSRDAQNFIEIGTVDGAGNSNVELMYQFTDENPVKGINYYRLKQTDFNGEFSYSKIIALSNQDHEASIFVTNSELQIKLDAEISSGTVTIYDAVGRVVYVDKITWNKEINTNSFGSGIYLVKVSTPTNNIIQKIKF